MKPITLDTGRITLTLTTPTIKALRLLAILKGENQNAVAEALLVQGGLHGAVDSEWSGGKPDTAPDKPSPAPPPGATASIPSVLSASEPSLAASVLSVAPLSGLRPSALMTDDQIAAYRSSSAMAATPPKVEPARLPLPPAEDPDDEKAPWD